MSMRVSANDKDGALETFQSCWVLVTGICTLLLLIVTAFAWSIRWQHWLRLSSLNGSQAATIVLVLSAYVIVGQQNSLTESGFRCDGNFALGTFWINVVRLMEAVLAATVAAFGGGLLAAAMAYLLVRTAGSIGYACLLRHKSPWLELGVRHARLLRIRELVAPALGFIAFPMAQSLCVQGFTILVGVALGPLAVVSFSTLRTLTRFNFQVLNVIGVGVWPELSSAFGAGKLALARTLHRHAVRAALVLSMVCGLALSAAGPYIYRIWIHGSVQFDAPCFYVLLLVTLANSTWYVSSVVPMAANSHHRMAFLYLALTLASLCCAWSLVHRYGTLGAALALLLIDLGMLWVVLRAALDQLQDTTADFARAIFLCT
jgi:O-antigen/teichoic acid export membrane protein